jgi:hypothetical protein
MGSTWSPVRLRGHCARTCFISLLGNDLRRLFTPGSVDDQQQDYDCSFILGPDLASSASSDQTMLCQQPSKVDWRGSSPSTSPTGASLSPTTFFLFASVCQSSPSHALSFHMTVPSSCRTGYCSSPLRRTLSTYQLSRTLVRESMV